MRPVQHPGNNDILRAPPGMTPDQCVDLHITRVQYADGQRGVWSYWQPSIAERQAIALGSPVLLIAMGDTHPPVALQVEDPAGRGMVP